MSHPKPKIDVEYSEADVLEGAWYAIEEAGLFIRRANQLYKCNDWSGEVTQAMLGCEEVGRYKILRNLAVDMRASGQPTAQSEIEKRCEDRHGHLKKRRSAISGVSLNPPPSEPAHEAIKALSRYAPHSKEYQRAGRIIDAAVAAKMNQLPRDRHRLRMQASYVGMDGAGGWYRPKSITQEKAWRALTDACNDYASAFCRLPGEHMPVLSAELTGISRGSGPCPRRSRARARDLSAGMAGSCVELPSAR